MRAAALVFAVVVLSGCGGGAKKTSFAGSAISPPLDAPQFTLSDQAGAPITLAAQRGHYVVVTFLYTHCPDVCPVIASTLNRVLQTRLARAARLRVLAISVDPRGDTPASVNRFVREHRLSPEFRYLTGSRGRLAPVWKSFHVAATAGPSATVSHSAFEILIDPQGRERLVYDSSVTAGALEGDLHRLMRSA